MASFPESHPVPEAEPGAAAPNDDAPTRLDQWQMTPWRLLSPSERGATFEEVIQGFDADSVLVEAQRCLLCKHPTCISGCPNNNPIPTYIGLVQEGRILEAAVADYEKNSLAACPGRVCNWEAQCEGNCVLNTRGEGVRIGAIERYIADYALRHKDEFEALMAQRAAERAVRGSSAYTAAEVSPFAATVTAYGNASPEAYVPPYGIPDDTPLAGHTVGVVGAGPAGLACADYLSRRGCAVVVFEAQHYAGGLLADGIPEFVLPEDTVEGEVARLRDQGVVFRFETVLGSDMSLDDLRREFDAVFLGIGATTARRTGVAGEDAEGVWTAQEFLRRTKLALAHALGPEAVAPKVGGRVLVIGAGNTSVDSARTSLRLGARDVRIVYRRTRAESPSRDIEIEHAETEHVRFEYLVNPVAYLKDGQGRVRAARLVRMRLGDPDSSGRRRPGPIPGSEFDLPCDQVILAVGYAADSVGIGHPEILNRDGTVHVHHEGGDTDLAGGDLVRGPMTVVHAIRDGRLAADAIGEYLPAQDNARGLEAAAAD